MANNRLYIIDTAARERFMIMKSMGHGWYVRARNKDEPCMCARLEDWLDKRDRPSYGNISAEPTKLRLVTENCDEFEEWR